MMVHVGVQQVWGGVLASSNTAEAGQFPAFPVPLKVQLSQIKSKNMGGSSCVEGSPSVDYLPEWCL